MYTILFRRSLEHEDEFEVAKKYFNVVEYRTECPSNHKIIGRYSVLPYYQELEKDLKNIGSELADSYEQHLWIANLDYYEVLKDYTPETWFDHNFYLCEHPGPFVLKGRTNSRKHKWSTSMFAENRAKASLIANELAGDALIGPQGVAYRKYVPLVRFETGINGLPFSNEFRIFYYRGIRLCHGYYWSQCAYLEKAHITEEALKFADDIAGIVKDYVNFFVLDIAEKQEGGWILIEINHGTMSGLSLNDPEKLYGNLKKALIEIDNV